MKTDRFDIKSNKYLITGAASGIGKATALLLSEKGADLILVDIDEKGLAETAKLCDTKIKLLALDLSDTDNIATSITLAIKDFGKLHGIVHAAGVPYVSPLKSISLERLRKTFDINTFAALQLAKTFCNKNVHEQTETGSSIVFISSIYASVGSSSNSGYAMSKAAIEGLTKALAIEFASRKIRVNCIAPGFVKTPMDKNIATYFDSEHEILVEKLHPLGLGEPLDVACAVAFLFSDAAKWITGTVMHVDGGFTAE